MAGTKGRTRQQTNRVTAKRAFCRGKNESAPCINQGSSHVC